MNTELRSGIVIEVPEPATPDVWVHARVAILTTAKLFVKFIDGTKAGGYTLIDHEGEGSAWRHVPEEVGR